MKRIMAAMVLGGVALAPVSVSTAGMAGGGPPPAMPVEVAKARVAPVVRAIGAVGSVEADEAVVIRPEVAGRIVEVSFREGAAVGAGDVLFVLDQAEAKARVAQGEAALNLARMNFERARDLLAQKLASQQDFDAAQARLKEAQARLDLDRVALDRTVLAAPFAGIAGLRRVSPGDYVAAGRDLVNVESLDPVKLDFRIPEAHASALRSGLAVTVEVDAFPGRGFSGTVYAVDPRVDAATRTLLVRARIANPRHELRPGMFARVRIVLGNKPDAVWIPEEAVVPRGRDKFVYRVNDGTAEFVRIESGERREGEIEVRDGIAAGDTVVVGGQMRIRPGAAVKPLSAAPAGNAP